MNTYINVQMKTIQEKPDTYHSTVACPFCDKTKLKSEERTVYEEGNVLLVRNKYPVMEETDPYVLIETDTCQKQFHTMTKEEAIHLFTVSFSIWKKMRSADYQDVIFFKNFGPQSAGSIQHGHMQFIGLYDVKTDPLDMRHTEGELVAESNGTRVVLSKFPMAEGYEWYVIGNHIPTLAVFAQTVSKYIIDTFSAKSYNFSFHYGDSTVIRITPCIRHTPLFLGYRLSQVPSDIIGIARKVRSYITPTT